MSPYRYLDKRPTALEYITATSCIPSIPFLLAPPSSSSSRPHPPQAISSSVCHIPLARGTPLFDLHQPLGKKGVSHTLSITSKVVCWTMTKSEDRDRSDLAMVMVVLVIKPLGAGAG